MAPAAAGLAQVPFCDERGARSPAVLAARALGQEYDAPIDHLIGADLCEATNETARERAKDRLHGLTSMQRLEPMRVTDAVTASPAPGPRPG